MNARALMIVGVTLLATGQTSWAAEYDICARGSGVRFSRTAKVRLVVTDGEIRELARPSAGVLVNRLLWRSQATTVTLDWASPDCPGAYDGTHSITLKATTTELDEMGREQAEEGRSFGATTLALLNRARLTRAVPPAVATEAQPWFTVRVNFVTNRKPTGKILPSEFFGPQRGARLVYGRADVTLPKDHRMADLESPSIIRLEFSRDPRRHATLAAVSTSSTPDAWRRDIRVRARAHRAPGILLFVHGFNDTFEHAALRTGQLAYDLGFEGPVVLFSWPSSGTAPAYIADSQAAEWSISHMQQVLEELASLAGDAPVYVIAHSMGNRVLAHAFSRALSKAHISAFREIILAAPDIDADVFSNDIAPILRDGKSRITIYASDTDKALLLSRQLHGDGRRLGQAGDAITVVAGMDTIDASSVSTDFMAHSYFAEDRTVMSDVFYLIRGSAGPASRFGLVKVVSSRGEYWRIRP